jgi:V8-like Glu-specific endopeptidase
MSCFLSTAGLAAAASDDVTLTLIPSSTVYAQPGVGKLVTSKDTMSVKAQADGEENTDKCGQYGRRSAASGRADVIAPSASAPKTLSYRLEAVANALGGHYRTGNCLGGSWIKVKPNDTEAAVKSTASAVVRIHFEDVRPNVPYFVKVSRSQRGSKEDYELVGPDGKVIPKGNADSPYPLIMSKPGQDYFLRSSVTANAKDKGGCCSDEASAVSDMTVSVEVAPLLFAFGQSAFIAGGKQTSAYDNVAVILLEGLPHCTATLVSPSTLVTAAHCVKDHMTPELLAQGKITAVFGSIYTQPAFAPVQIVEAKYQDSGPQKFDPKHLVNDIAVVQLKTKIPAAKATPSPLHTGVPTWEDIKSKQLALTFVGFGYDIVNGKKVQVGIKREASWAITSYDAGAIWFSTPGTNTCNGDSGGPAFLNVNQQLVLVAVTSGGDMQTCKSGFDTRVDAYLAWLTPQIVQ